MNRRWKFPDRSLLLLLGVLALAVWVIWRAVPSLLVSAAIMMAAIVDIPAPMPREMKAMCDKDAGVHIYSRVADVDGYAILPSEDSPTVEEIAGGEVSNATIRGGCFPCFEELIRDGYKFIETYFIAVADQKWDPAAGLPSRKGYDVKTTGLYRYHLIERNLNPDLCTPFDRVKYKAREIDRLRLRHADTALVIFGRQYKKFETQLSQKCVYAEPIDEFSSRYQIRLHQQIIDVRGWLWPKGSIHRLRSSVETVGGTIIAEAIFYRYVPGEREWAARGSRCGSLSLPPTTELLQPSESNKGGDKWRNRKQQQQIPGHNTKLTE